MVDSGLRRMDLPSSCSEQGIDHSRVHCRVLQLLNERRLMESHTGWEGLGDDPITLGHQLGRESAQGQQGGSSKYA